MAKHILPQLMQHGRVVRGYLGLHGRSVCRWRRGWPASSICPGRGGRGDGRRGGWPGGSGGLEEGDMIVALGDQPTTSVDDLHKLLTKLPVGVPAAIVLLREERRLEAFRGADGVSELALSHLGFRGAVLARVRENPRSGERGTPKKSSGDNPLELEIDELLGARLGDDQQVRDHEAWPGPPAPAARSSSRRSDDRLV